MDSVKFLTREQFIYRSEKTGGCHWERELIEDRWDYHSRVVKILRSLNIQNAGDVLEMGTMGMSCVVGSDTIDYLDNWNFEGKNPTHVHDARIIPWPIQNKQYEVFIALRVFQHLAPHQESCIKEASRIAKKMIIIAPREYNIPVHPDSKGIEYATYVNVLEGIHPNLFLPTKFGDLYFWDFENRSFLNLETVMEHYQNFLVEDAKKRIGLLKKIKGKLMSVLSRQ